MNITKTITGLNEYGNGFEATVGINCLGSIDFDITYVADGEITPDGLGILLTAEAARALANTLHNYADKSEGVTNGW